ncbi:MAG TPA: ferritin-like domain-containing protein [Solirubrobacteraceae bacterium]|nr:ferritin-like domain-containing protein [Solirubrobacteraceae bacterium]
MLAPAAPASEEASGSVSRRSFVATGLAVGAGAAIAPFGRAAVAIAGTPGGKPTKGDVAILRFLAAAEILETDLWQQYNELGGIQDAEVPGGSGSKPYVEALQVLDEDMPQYIHDNTEDEHSHFAFINAYLESMGAEPVDLGKFAELPSSQATGAAQTGRLTNLMELTVDTSYWTRYRSRTGNPDLGDTFKPAVPGLLEGRFPAIPRSDEDLEPEKHLQAIANTAGFHFAFIEGGGTSLYPSLAQRVHDPEVLRILLSIGPTETMHFQTWHDKAGNAPALTDPKSGLVFPNLNEAQPGLVLEDTKTNLIMPEPTAFLSRKFPPCSIIRPTNTAGAAMGAVKGLTDDGLFRGQPPAFFRVLKELAAAADAATARG